MPLTERHQVITFTDPKSNKQYFIKARFIPTSRLSSECQDELHGQCFSFAGLLIRQFRADSVLKMACLCTCHHDKETK
jgi:hypothetical protein